MDTGEILRQIFAYSDRGESERIIEFVKELPPESRTLPVLCQMACAYNNTGQPDEAIKVLRQVEDEGKEQAVWNYFLGYAYCSKGENALAKQHFFQARKLNSQLPLGTILFYCTEHPEDSSHDALLQLIADTLPAHCEIEHDIVVLPQWGLAIHAEANFPNEQQAVVEYTITGADWEREMFEVCTAVGKTREAALFEAQRAFVTGIFDTIKSWLGKRGSQVIETRLGEHQHLWDVYVSDMLVIGDNRGLSAADYWQQLQERIRCRMGNQELCYIKVYLAKGEGFSTGECRINNIVCEEISEMLKIQADSWENEFFTSHKMFFVLAQQEDTRRPYPYTRPEMEALTLTAASLFETMAGQGDGWYERYPEELSRQIDDSTLVSSFYRFLPELCTLRVLSDIKVMDEVIFQKENSREEYYLSQLSDWDYIRFALNTLINKGKITDSMYRTMIGCSSSVQAYQNGLDRNADMKGPRLTFIFMVDDDYQIR